MRTKTSLAITGALLGLSLIAGAAAFAESPSIDTGGVEDPMAEAQAFLASPTSLSQAIATAEAAAGGKVSGIEYQSGENGAPDLIMADVVLADGTEMTVAINPADGKVMSVTAMADIGDDESGDNDAEGEGSNG